MASTSSRNWTTRERLFRCVDQMRGIVGRLLPARGGGGEEAGMAAHDDGHIDAGHGAKIEVYADKGISDEGGGRDEAGDVIVLHQVVIDGLGGMHEMAVAT
jgi:hypothetical protein